MSDCLPDKPSELIRVALADLRKCEKDKRYGVDMGDWHSPDGSRCYVCLAGAVMAKTLGAPIGESKSAGSYGSAPLVSDRLCALDDFRRGEVSDGLEELGILSPYRTMSIPDYDADNPDDFHKAMSDMSDMFRREGL